MANTLLSRGFTPHQQHLALEIVNVKMTKSKKSYYTNMVVSQAPECDKSPNKGFMGESGASVCVVHACEEETGVYEFQDNV